MATLKRGMKRALRTLGACATLLLAAGCGSSGGSGTSGSSGYATVGSRGVGSGASHSSGSGPSTGASGGVGFKAETTPAYAKPAPSSPVQSGSVEIAYRDITISPDAVRVKVGATIRWTNYDPIQENVTSEGGPQRIDSKDFGQGRTFEVKVTKPGVIHYVSATHPASMNGTIEVVG